MIHIHYLHQLVIIVQLASQAAMKAYYWSDLSGYVISDKSMSQRTKNLSKRMNIDTYSFTDFRFHFFIDFDCHQFRLFVFSKQIFISRDGKLKSPLFFFFDLQLKSYGLKLYELLVGDPILSLEIQMRILHLFEFIHLWFLLMKYKWIKIETVSSLLLSNPTGNAKTT